jgi:hypothetical protein
VVGVLSAVLAWISRHISTPRQGTNSCRSAGNTSTELQPTASDGQEQKHGSVLIPSALPSALPRQGGTGQLSKPAAQDSCGVPFVVLAVIWVLMVWRDGYVWVHSDPGGMCSALADMAQHAMRVPLQVAGWFATELVAFITVIGLTALGCRCYGTSLTALTQLRFTWGATCMGLVTGLLAFYSARPLTHAYKAVKGIWHSASSELTTCAELAHEGILNPASLQDGGVITVALTAIPSLIFAPVWEEV